MGVILCTIVIQNRGADEGVKALKLEVDGGVKALKLEADEGCKKRGRVLESCEIGMLSDGNVNYLINF